MVYTNKQKFNKKYGFKLNTPHSLDAIAKITKIKKSILQQVYNRGTGAWKTNPQSVRIIKGKKLSKEAWSISRVYSFVMGGRTTKTADKDLYIKIKK